MTATLPDKPSELIRVALDDLAKCEADPDSFTINMGDWLVPENGKCSVCLAGAVMAQSINVDRSRALTPYFLGESVRDKLLALNLLRVGDVRIGLSFMGIDKGCDMPSSRMVARYRDDPAQFRADMLQLAADLAAHNL